MSKVIRVGGVAETVSSAWDEEKEFERAKIKAFVELCRELEIEGRLKVGPAIHSGDYRKKIITLDIG